MIAERAEEIAILALGWLARDTDIMGAFLGSTGLAASDLPQMAAAPEFLAAVLDFLLTSDAWVVAFAAEYQLDPAEAGEARQVLAGAEMHWT